MSPKTLTVDLLLREGVRRLAATGVPEPEANAEFILSEIAGMSRTQLVLARREPIAGSKARRFFKLIQRRSRRLPLGYVLGHQPFMGLSLQVNKSVLIPRPETEELVRAAVDLADRSKALAILDVCTGSGCIALALARNLSRAKVIGLDISAEALKVARANAVILKLQGQVRFSRSDLFRMSASRWTKFDLIVSNPPYIPTGRIRNLDAEVRKEPRLALDGGLDGLEAIAEIISWSPRLLTPGGRIILEIDSSHGRDVRHLLRAAGLGEVEIRRDCQGLPRIAIGKMI